MTVTTIPVTGITVDGVPLNTLAKTIESKTGRLRVAAARGSNAVVANRSGSIWTPNKPSEEGRFILPMWVNGCDDDGLIPGGSTALKEFYKNKDDLQRLFSKRRSLLEVLAAQPDGTTRRCLAECTAEVDYEMFNEHDARMAYELTIPSVYWEDSAELTYSTGAITANTTFTNVPDLSGGTAPMEDMAFEWAVTGAGILAPRITDLYTGDFININGYLTAGQWLMVNSAKWVARRHTAAINWSDTIGENVTGILTRSNTVPRMMVLTPHPVTGAVGFSITSADWQGGSSLTFRIKGRRKYHS